MKGTFRLALSVVVAAGGGIVADAPPAGAAEVHVAMSESRFRPPESRVRPGERVVWSNKDGFAHAVRADDGSWDSSPACEPATGTGCMDTGDTWSRSFPRAGRYPYHCKLHGQPGNGMTGVVIVG